MGIPIKYSSTVVNNTIKTNNIVFGTKTMDYGPTSSTGFYVGVDPPSSGYTIYTITEPSKIPKAVCADSDDDVIYFARSFGGININTINEAFTYLVTGSTGTTIVNMNYPSIVTSGLTLNLDTGFLPSYPKSGNKVYDLSGNNYNGTIVGTLPFIDADGGYFDYSYSGNGITLGITPLLFPGTTDYTWCGWMKFGGFTGNWREIWYGNAGGGNRGFGILLKSSSDMMRLVIYGTTGGEQLMEFSTTSYLNNWHYYTFVIVQNTFNVIIYIDSNYLTTFSYNNWGSIDSQGFAIKIGYHLTPDTWQYNGSIAPIHVYNKSLSQGEITQNYNALKSRFGY